MQSDSTNSDTELENSGDVEARGPEGGFEVSSICVRESRHTMN